MKAVSQHYRNVLLEYLNWRTGNFLRPPNVPLDATGPSPEEAMKLWESEGKVPTSCSDPDKLADYIQGKKSRDWHITEWKQGVEDCYFLREEFIGTLGLTLENFSSIFGREPNMELFEHLRLATNPEFM